MRSLQLLLVLVTTCLPTAFAEIIDNTDAKKVITENGANISGTYTIQNAAGKYMRFERVGPPGHSFVSLSFVSTHSTVAVESRSIYGQSGHRYDRFTGVSLSGSNKCAATQFNSTEGRDYAVVAYGCTFDKNHTGAKMIFNVLACGNSPDALSLAQKISGASKKEDFKFKKANPKSAPSQKSSGKSGAHGNSPHHQPGHHVGGYRGRRHSGHGRRRGGHGGHGGHGHKGGNHHGGGHGHKGGNHHGGGHGHKGGNHHGGGHGHKGGNHRGGSHPRHHHVRSLCTGNSLACQRRRQYLAKRDVPMSVSPQGPSPQYTSPQNPVPPSGVPATRSGTPKQSASGASGGAGSTAGDHGPGLQSKAKKTQDGAVSQQASKDPNPPSGEGKSNSEIAEHLRKGLLSGEAQTVCIVGQDHLGDMQTAGLTGQETVGAGGVPGIVYDLFDPTKEPFWLTMTRVN